MKHKFTAAFLFLLTLTTQGAGQVQSFSPAGSMSNARTLHTATLLQNGTVLVAGGFSPGASTYATADLYDPDSGLFSATGSLTTARRAHTATLLPNGKVLVAGGRNPPSYFASADLYDPDTGQFSATGSLITPRAFHTATLLSNGKVLFAGGLNAGVAVGSAELYDPETGIFSATGALNTARTDQTATLLPNGKVLVTGGSSGSTTFTSAELYDPDRGSFTNTGNMSNARQLHAATLLPPTTPWLHGKVLITGGSNGTTILDSAELFDPDTGLFSSAGTMTAARQLHTATLVPAYKLRPHGKVLVDGGQNAAAAAGADLYDPDTGIFSAAGNMNVARRQHTATMLLDGTLLVTGGDDGSAAGATAELYFPPSTMPAPTLLSVSGNGRGQGAIQHGDTYQFASASNPAVAGEILAVYFTGLVEKSVVPPQITIGGRMAEILFFGSVAGYPSLNQLNVRVPSGIAPGSAVPVRLTYLGRTSNEVTIGVR